MIVEYGKDIEDIYNQIKELISTEVNNMTHLDVIEVNVNVADIKHKKNTKRSRNSTRQITEAAKSTGQFASRQTDKANLL